MPIVNVYCSTHIHTTFSSAYNYVKFTAFTCHSTNTYTIVSFECFMWGPTSAETPNDAYSIDCECLFICLCVKLKRLCIHNQSLSYGSNSNVTAETYAECIRIPYSSETTENQRIQTHTSTFIPFYKIEWNQIEHTTWYKRHSLVHSFLVRDTINKCKRTIEAK